MRLIARDIVHRYQGLTALDGVSLEVGAREVVAVIGPSGCGKSTLLTILGGLLAPSAGTVALDGLPPAGSLNPLTYVFQDFALLPWATVEGNIALALSPHGLAPAERARRIADVLARTGLTAFRGAHPKALSGGMRQRVGIARALVVNPAVLLMDEPLSALDAQTREIMIEDFESLFAREPVAAVYVTHNLDEAVRLAHRILVLSRRPGRMKAVLEVGVPPGQRRAPAAVAKLAAVREELWSLIADEARAAIEEQAP